MIELGTIQAIAYYEPQIAEFGVGDYYTRVRRGVTERVRKGRSNKKRKMTKLKKRAFAEYKKGKPGLLEKTGAIPDRKYAKYEERNRYSKKTVKGTALKAYRQGKPGLLEKAGIIENRRG